MNKSKSEALLARRKDAVANGVGVFNTATVQLAKDATIIDVDGNELIDFTGGIGVINAGHCPQPVIDAIIDQAQKYIHTSFNVVTYEPYIALCEKLNSLFPHGGKAKTMLVNTGAEAVENAIKIAKQATGRNAVICYSGAFHGRTLMAMTLTSRTSYGAGCGPFAPEVYRVDYPDFYKNGAGKTQEAFVINELNKLEEYFETHVRHQDVAAIIIELVQGEGGFTVAPKSYIKGLREVCDKYGIVLIFDEVQTGFGRTAAWGASAHFDVQPDISTWAKSMGSGLPIGAVVGKQEIMDSAGAGTIGGTYIGNPLACAASLATIKYMEDINLNDKAKKVGEIVRNRFEILKAKHAAIGEVRGLGAMIAMEFVKNSDPQQPDYDLCNKLIKACAERGLIVIAAGVHKNVLRILVPLVISEELLNKGLDIIAGELEKLSA
ncbi:aspartate aminotransferase family protein [Taibaiella lutea]|uniref:Aspartate aminotransferase family protein n=1 Tax=Taibaiella lutea TaxID=2608001 RepID=A0A5M6CPP9_9BACT|nr:aspartate aminotransferase family protein [Taibaiella lutea]KAA5536976.1 aspartate aminotransferase family protein [Taibaiella lutea]